MPAIGSNREHPLRAQQHDRLRSRVVAVPQQRALRDDGAVFRIVEIHEIPGAAGDEDQPIGIGVHHAQINACWVVVFLKVQHAPLARIHCHQQRRAGLAMPAFSSRVHHPEHLVIAVWGDALDDEGGFTRRWFEPGEDHGGDVIRWHMHVNLQTPDSCLRATDSTITGLK